MPTSEQFISEPIAPDLNTLNTAMMARGEPGLPQSFTWRDTQYTVAEILDSWKESGPCTHGSAEIYLRKHWYKIRTVSGEIMKLYFERQHRSNKQTKQRWWLYTLVQPA